MIGIGGLRRDNVTGIPTHKPPQSRPTGLIKPKIMFILCVHKRRGQLPRRPASSRSARLEVPGISIDMSVSRLQSAGAYGNVHSGLRGRNIAITTILQPPQYTASAERDEHFVNVIHKGLTLPIDKILRKRGSG